MDASDSKLSSVKSSSFLLITGLTILSALFITILVVIQEVHDPIRIGEMIFFMTMACKTKVVVEHQDGILAFNETDGRGYL